MWDGKIAMLEKIIDFYHFVFGENMLCYHSRVAGLHRIIATYNVAQGKYDETLDCLERMLYHIQKPQYILNGRLTHSRYDPIRETPRFAKIVEELSMIAE